MYSFGSFYDPDRIGFGPIAAYDEHLLRNGEGFDMHHHEGVTIVTRVLSGALTHTDSAGNNVTISPGQVGIFNTGDGVDHSEIAAAPQTRFVQVWLSESSGEPAYETRTVAAPAGEWAAAAELERATLSIATIGGEHPREIALPTAEKRHLYVASGALLRSSLAEPLSAGDAFELTDAGEVTVAAQVPTELLLWSFH
ncbi:MAG: pirin family protein [Nocardioides sp.]|nr:pirin family protein [Nocardioides sp.]